MTASPTLWDRIRRSYEAMPPAQRRVADLLLANASAALFLTADEVAAKAGTSPASVVRFAMTLGYGGFPALRRDFQKLATDSLRPADRVERTGAGDRSVARRSLRQDAKNLQALMRTLDVRDLDRAVRLIEKADRVFVAGARSSYSIAWLLGLLLSQVRAGVVSLSSVDPVPVDVADIGEGDVLLAVSLPRYTTTTLRVGRYFRQRRAKLVLIADSLRSPLAGAADVVLPVPHESVSFFNSNVAATALANALIVALVARRRAQTRRRLEHWEDVWRHFHTHAIEEPPRGRRTIHGSSSRRDR